MTSPAPASAAPRRPALPRALGALAFLLFLLVLGEITARAFWRIRHGMSLVDTRGSATMFYPAVGALLRSPPVRHDSVIDVLLLGGSTLHPFYGGIAAALQERLTAELHRTVTVHNFGVPAHTSRDSYFKYRALEGSAFDVVILYDGFNEARANNVPPERFRDDYSHYAWYELVNDILDGHKTWPLATPYTVRYLARTFAVRRADRSGHPIRVPRHEPDSAWTLYGSTIRTAEPFARNVAAILDTAAARGDPVILVTFAAWFAPGYTFEKFKARQLDYAVHALPTETWGRPANVAAAVAAHNAKIRDLHRARPEAGFVDMDSLLPHQGAYFNDACHLTIAGSERFVDLLMPAVRQKLGLTP